MRQRPLHLVLVLPALTVACLDDPVSPRELSPAEARPVFAAAPTQSEASAIDANLRATHLPHGTIADPIFASGDPASPDYATIVGYDHAGDAAIWTGHYLAAEAYRHAVTGATDALDNTRQAVDAIVRLVDVTSPARPDLLARFYMPRSWEYAGSVMAIEARHGIYESNLDGVPYYWIGNTTRDQYAGVFFGLAAAYDLVPDDALRARIAAVVTRMLDFLLRNGWNVVMPDGSISSTFNGRVDQQLALLQIGRHVNPVRYQWIYRAYRLRYGLLVGVPVTVECQDPHGSYYKFNLDHITFFNLIRLEEPSSFYRLVYLRAFNTLRGCTGTHMNAHFNMIDRALRGANATRDAATREYLGEWLTRPRRDYAVDLSEEYAACGENRACEPIPVAERPPTDFLWQRSPFLLYGGGTGQHETPGIDYLLPYWMGRYYGVIAQ